MDDLRRSNQKRKPQGFGYRMLELRALGLEPQDARKLLISISRWTKARGIKGAIDYCSSLEEVMKANLNGDLPPTTKCWVARSNGFPRAVKFLRKYSISLQRRMVPLKRLFHVDAFTSENVEKFVKAASSEADRGYKDSLEPLLAVLRLGTASIRRNTNLSYLRTPSNRVVNYAQLVYLKETSTPKGLTDEQLKDRICLKILSDIQHLRHHPQIRDNIYVSAALSDFKSLPIDYLLNGVFESGSHLRDLALNVNEERPSAVGGVYASSEPGCKLRVFASPRLIYQASLAPLFDALMEILEVLPSDCTKDQESGALWAQEQLKLGKVVHSVDTRSATDKTPYYLQRELLKMWRICHQMLTLFDTAVEGDWLIPASFGIKRSTIAWKRGQPLGLLPSFACYALFHNTLLIGICEKNRVKADCFRIVGDDIVISNDVVHRDYLRALELMEVETSKEKSFSSCDYAEFAGYFITKYQIIRAGKFRPLKADNFLAKVFDPAMVFPEYLVPRRLRDKLKKLATEKYPKGMLPLTDQDINMLNTDEVYDIINELLSPYNGRVRHIASETTKSLKFGLYPMLSGNYTTEQVACERFVAVHSNVDCITYDIFDPKKLGIESADVAPHQYEVVKLVGKIMFHVLTNAHKDTLELSRDIPLLSGYSSKVPRMTMLKDMIKRMPITKQPSELDGWCFLARIQKDVSSNELLETPKTVLRHWRRESSTLRYN